ncbi:uncharacterized protein ATC70_011966 [Mucor velutinosus]|uniref:Uncharacterized protein n=1 Tax=Mucor velutinosus TaxID=708070 RepID=A0AAN7DT54_9FUNG|nr:hypothetical protein ATC70_011966 [Mucor velutinosus]
MSTLENLTESFNRINFDASPHQAWLNGRYQRTSNRNLRIMPSDDEDEDEDEDEAIYSSEDSGRQSLSKMNNPKKLTKQKVVVTKPKSAIPLPSDEEDNTDQEEEENDEDDDELLPIHQSMPRPMHGGLPYRINRSAPTLPQQFEPHPIQHLFMHHSDGSTNSNHSSSIATKPQNQRSVSTDDLAKFLKDGQQQSGGQQEGGEADDEDNEVLGQHLRYASNSLDVPPTLHHLHQYQQYHQQQQLAQFQYLQQQQQQQHVANTSMQPRNLKQQQQQQQQQSQQQRMTTMSGMDLLIQREQERAEAKRQKPKMNPGKVKIEGLLGKLPEPGTHNINFQQIQQQQQQQQQQQLQQQMHQQHYMNSPVPTMNGSKKYSHANRQVYYQQQPQPQPYGYVPNPPSMYDYYSNGRSSVPPMNHSMYSAQPSFYQLPNYTSSGNLYTTMMAPPGSQSLPQTNRPGSAMSSYPNNNQKQQPRSTTPVSLSPQHYQQH